MRRPASSTSTRVVAQNIPIVAPVKGWNVVDSIANMAPEYALFMDNAWPTPTRVDTRKGWIEFAHIPTDDPGGTGAHDIRGILSYNSPDGTNKLFVADQTGIYDVTVGGAALVADTPSTNGDWRSTNVSTAGGHFLWCCNGVDKSRYYNGTTWTVLDGFSTPALTGVASTDIVNLVTFKSRLYVLIKNTLQFGYLDVNSIAGTVHIFDLGVIFNQGGHLVGIDTWDFDAGKGIDDYICFWTSEGEVAIYEGYDPSNAANWSLVGVYNVGAPLSYNSTAKVGGDLLLLTVQGIYPIGKALEKATVDRKVALSYNIQEAFNFYISTYKDLFGWQILFYPEATMLLVNVPFKRDDPKNFLYSYQFAMNTTHNAWTRFTNQAAEVWGLHNRELFFAKHNKIYRAWVGQLDGNSAIRTKIKQAFTMLRSATNKQVQLVKPIIQSNGTFKLGLSLDVDFNTDALLISQGNFNTAVSLWDSAKFNVDSWTGTTVDATWRTVAADVGMWFSVTMQIETKTDGVAWIATQYSVIPGGQL